MRIVLYCPNKPLSHPDPSGDQIIARGIRKALNELGHECREIVRFRSRWFWTSPEGWLQAFAALAHSNKEISSFGPNIWLTYHTYYKSPDVLGPWLSRMHRIPYVLFQPMYATRRRKDPETRFGFYLNRIALKASCHAFTNNVNDLEALNRILPSRRVTYLPPGIFPRELQRSEAAREDIRRLHKIPLDIPLLLTVARFRPDVKFQSLAYLFDCLTLVQNGGHAFRLLLVGDGPMENELHRLSDTLLPGRVVFAGRVAHEKMGAYYSAADLFVFPGIGESLGMVFLEAQACGLPVVALDTAGIPQVVLNGRTAILVRENDRSAMASAIELLLADRSLRKRFGENGIRFIDQERNLNRNYLHLSQKLVEIASGSARHLRPQYSRS